MSKGTLLITGATGFLGFSILLGALREGYTAHIVVRSASKQAAVQNAPDLLALPNNAALRCHFFIAPDLTAPGALDAAATGCDLVLHAASPLPFRELCPPERQHAEFIAPAEECTLAALESAKRAGTVKRVVCISSIGGFITPELLGPEVPEEKTWLSDETLNDYLQPPFQDMLTAYCASKTAALRKSLEWMEEEQRREGRQPFDLVNMAPIYVAGRHALATSTADLFGTSNAVFLQLVAGKTAWKEGDVPEVVGGVHIDDVVELHLAALDTERIKTPTEGPRKGVEMFVIGYEMQWKDVTDAVAKLFPEAVEKGLVPNNGFVGSKTTVVVSKEKTERVFGIKLKGVEEMMASVMPQYLEFVEKEKVAKA